MTIADIARADVVTADPGTTISELAFTMANGRVGSVVVTDADDGVMDTVRAMCAAEVRRVPVVEDSRLVGIVTLDDFRVQLAGELSNLAGVVEAESPPYA